MQLGLLDIKLIYKIINFTQDDVQFKGYSLSHLLPYHVFVNKKIFKKKSLKNLIKFVNWSF